MNNVRVTRPARKHRIGNARIIAAMVDAGAPVALSDGKVETGGLAVIHAMPTSDRE